MNTDKIIAEKIASEYAPKTTSKLKALKKERKKRAKDNKLLAKIRKKKNKKNLGVEAFVGLATTIFALVAILFIYTLSYLTAPTHTLVADVTVVRGGYQLTYPHCTMPIDYFDKSVKIGDIVNVSDQGYIEELSRNTLQMRIEKIEDKIVYLSFVAVGVPDFMTTEEFQGLLQYNPNAMQQYQKVYLKGKVVAGRFSVFTISLERR